LFGLDFSCPIKDWLYNVTAIQGKYGPYIAGNSSTTEIQALGLELQMKRNSEIIRTRREAAEYLSKRFSECDAIIPQDLGEDVEPTFHLYLLKLIPEKAGGNIQALKAKLKEKGVTEIAHFGPLYRFQAVQDMGYNSEEIAKSCPNCEDIFYKRYTHLPVYGLSQSQLEYLADAVLNSIKEMQEGR
jgi:dTDP-4-amino-4,6-dideoxygalactose transaminase